MTDSKLKYPYKLVMMTCPECDADAELHKIDTVPVQARHLADQTAGWYHIYQCPTKGCTYRWWDYEART